MLKLSSHVHARNTTILCVATAMACCGQRSFGAAVFYDIGAALNQPTAQSSVANAINDSGVIVGAVSLTSTSTKAFTYTVGGTATTYAGGFGVTGTYADGINNAGTITGFTLHSDNNQYAFMYAEGGAIQGMGTVSAAVSINTSGVAAGIVQSGSVNHAALFTPTTAGSYAPAAGAMVHDIGSLVGVTGASLSTAINNNGQVTGHSDTATFSVSHAFLYSNGVMTDLTPTLSGTSDGKAINASGTVAGFYRSASGYVPFLSNGTTFTTLGKLSSNSNAAFAEGIDDAGDAIGYDLDSTYTSHAVLWVVGSLTPIDLNTYFASVDPTDAAHWVLASANDINNNGLVVGEGYYTDPSTGTLYDRAFVLNVSGALVPEPASFGILGISALGLLRRRRSAHQ